MGKVYSKDLVEMRNGLYEVPLLKLNGDKEVHKEKLEKSELPKILSKDYQVMLRKKLESLDSESILPFYKNLYALLEEEEMSETDLLLVMHENNDLLRELIDHRPCV